MKSGKDNIQASESNIYCIRRFSALKWLEKITESVHAVYITFYAHWIPCKNLTFSK